MEKASLYARYVLALALLIFGINKFAGFMPMPEYAPGSAPMNYMIGLTGVHMFPILGIIDLEFKTAEGTNSGVVVYASDIDDWIPNSVEIQIADDYAKQWSEAPATWQCGAAFGRLAATERRVKQPGEWNRYTITAKDNIIDIALNGALVNRLDMSKWTHPTTNPDGSANRWRHCPLAATSASKANTPELPSTFATS